MPRLRHCLLMFFLPCLVATQVMPGCTDGGGAASDDGDVASEDTTGEHDSADGLSDVEDGGESLIDPAFLQPTGLAIVGVDESGQATVYYATVGAAEGFGQFSLSESGAGESELAMPTVERVVPEAAKPFTPMQIYGTGFIPEPEAAVSVVFEAPGLAPVAVPVLIATDTTLSVVAPVLIGTDGLDVRGTASVRIVQVLGDQHIVSTAFDSVTIERLPPIEGAASPAGTLTAAFLTSSAEFILASTPDDGALPGEFMGSARYLRGELGMLAARILDASRGTPVVDLPWVGGEPPVLDAATLDFMDRMVFAALRAPIAAIQADAEETAALPGTKSAPYGCPELEGTPEEQLQSMLCMHHGHPAAMARVGEPAVAAGFQVVSSVYLGFWGGAGAAVLGARSSQAALTFEVVWAGLTGHLTAWVIGQRRPTAGQTLADSGATLADRLLRTGGSLDTVWAMIAFGRTYDALIREAAATQTPDPEIDAGSDIGPENDAGDIGGEDDTISVNGVRYEGTATLYGDEMDFGSDEPCIGTPSVEVDVIIRDFSGDGTAASPYMGRVEVSGTFIAISSGSCAGSAGLATVTGPVGGLQGGVGFDLASGAPPRYEVAFTNGLVETATRTLTGDMVIEFWPEGRYWFGVDGTIELSEVD